MLTALTTEGENDAINIYPEKKAIIKTKYTFLLRHGHKIVRNLYIIPICSPLTASI